MEAKIRHTPFPWHRHDNGGTLPNVYKKYGGFQYGAEAADWVWGPKGPGYGVVADCSPRDKITDESRANAHLIASIPNIIAALEACIDELPGPCGREGCSCGSEARLKAIETLKQALLT